MTSTRALPVVIAARHVRLSAPHVEMLFGAGAKLTEIAPLPPTGTFACAEVVTIRGSAGALANVRVLGPPSTSTQVRVRAPDLATLGAAPWSIDGPRGTLVIASGVTAGLRTLFLDSSTAAALIAKGQATTNVTVEGDRPRELRDVPIEIVASASASWLAVDVDDAAALEVGPTTTASLPPQPR